MSTLKVTNIESPSGGGVSAKITDIGGGQLSNRNLIINGAMQVAQRGTSESGLTSGNNWILDRFRVYINSIGTYTISQASDAPAGFKYSYKVDCTTADASPAAADEIVFAYPFEGQDLQLLKKGLSGAEKVTLSFWVKSNKTTSGQVNFRDTENTRIIAATYTINAADTWEYKTITFDGDTSGTLTSDNAARMQIQWFLDSGSNSSSGVTPTAWEAEVTADKNATNFGLASSTANYWQITGVQLEVGDTATSFEHRSYGDELARCQRYYAKTYNNSVVPGTVSGPGILVGIVTSANFGYVNFVFPVDMRPSPTITLYNSATGATGTWRDGGNTDRAVTATSVGTTSCSIYVTTAAASSSFYGHAVASSEL